MSTTAVSDVVAVVLASGYGTRSLPISKVIPKDLGEVNGRPVIDYIMDDLALAGIREVIIAISPDQAGDQNYQEMLLRHWLEPSAYYETHLKQKGKTELLELVNSKAKGMNVRFSVTSRPDGTTEYGTAYPLTHMVDQLRGRKFVVVNGDDFVYRTDGGSTVKDLIEAVEQVGAAHGMIAMTVPHQDSGNYPYGIALTDAKGNLESLPEKPAAEVVGDRPALANVGKFYFSDSILDDLEAYIALPASERGQDEYYLTDVVSRAASHDPVLVVPSQYRFIDCGDAALRTIASLIVAGVPETTIDQVRKSLGK